VHGGLAVITTDRPEFRTAGKCTAATRDEIAAMASGIQSLVISRGGVVGISDQHPLTP
jgi:hypothetical protein